MSITANEALAAMRAGKAVRSSSGYVSTVYKNEGEDWVRCERKADAMDKADVMTMSADQWKGVFARSDMAVTSATKAVPKSSEK